MERSNEERGPDSYRDKNAELRMQNYCYEKD